MVGFPNVAQWAAKALPYGFCFIYSALAMFYQTQGFSQQQRQGVLLYTFFSK